MGNSKVSSVSQHESHNLILMLDLLFSGSIQSEKLRVLSLSSSSSPFVLATEKPAKKIGERKGKFLRAERQSSRGLFHVFLDVLSRLRNPKKRY